MAAVVIRHNFVAETFQAYNMKQSFIADRAPDAIPTKVKAARQRITNIVASNGADLFTILYPNEGKETILLLHGGPGFPDDLPSVVSLLQDRFQIITFHQRGTGKSPCRSNDYSMDAYVHDVEAIRTFYSIGKFHLWGHSWGGLYAQIYASRFGENLMSLFLCCPGSGTNTQWKQTEKEVLQLNKSKCTSLQWANMGWNSFLGWLGSDRAYRRLFTQVMKNYNNDFIDTENLESDFKNLRAEPINKTRPEIVRYPLLTRQANLPYPVTIVYGDQDIYQTSKNFVLERYPSATVITIENCGHIPWLHNPNDYKTILDAHYR
jgi:proline iminopeptidase